MDEVVVSTVELSMWEWLQSLTQKCNNILQKAGNRKEFLEEDRILLKVLYKVWDDGSFPVTKQKMEGIAEISVQSDIFNDIKSDDVSSFDDARDGILNGIEIDKSVIEPIK